MELALNDRAKHLGVILDKKLYWKPNTYVRITKVITALYIYPKNVNWIYKAVIKPIIFYGASV